MTEKIAAILTASARGETAKVQEMLESGDLTFACKDRMGRTPLHIASSEGHEDLVKHLLSLKADPTAKDKLGNTPFNDCVRSKHDNVVSLMRKDDPNISFKLGGNETGVLMCQAAFHNNIEDIKRLVVNGVDPNESDYDGRTALHLAASQGNITVMTYLIEVKANIMCRDRFNGTPLEDAVRHHFETQNADQVQKLLRDNGASLAGEGLNYVVKM
jgi:ankyrin repeat protein